MEERRILITYDKAREWFNGDNESLKEIALKAFSERELIHNFRDITTFKKACDELGYNYDDIVSKVKSIAEISKASAAMFKLNIIRKALNLRYDMHISKNVEDENYNHNPFLRLVIKGSTCRRSDLDRSRQEKLGEFISEGITYEIFNGGDSSCCDYKGLSDFYPDSQIGYVNADKGFLGCATEDVSRHLGKYFDMLIIEAMYADIVDFEIIEEKYKI